MADEPPVGGGGGGGFAPEIDHKDAAKLRAEGDKDSGEIERLASALPLAIVKLIAGMIRIVASNADEILAAVADLFHAAQAEGTKGFSDLVAALLGDLLGVEVDGEKIFQTFQEHGRIPAMEEVGKSLVDLLTNEFAPEGTLSAAQGEAAAKAFMGFVLSFSVREGNTDVLASLIPEEYRVGEGFKSYAEAMARNLGLGRLSRLALRPLVQTLLVNPHQEALNLRYRPKDLDAKDAVRGQLTGRVTTDELRANLARAGYSEDKIGVVIEAFYEHLSQEQLRLLKLFGLIPEEDYRLFLLRAGFNGEAIDNIEKFEEVKEKRAVSLQVANSLRSDVLDGVITPDEYADVLGRLALSDAERQGFTSILAEFLGKPRRTLTLAQMRQAFIDATIDIGELEAYLERVGYRESDRQILVIDALLRSAKHDEAKKRSEARKAPKSATPTKPPSSSGSGPTTG